MLYAASSSEQALLVCFPHFLELGALLVLEHIGLLVLDEVPGVEYEHSVIVDNGVEPVSNGEHGAISELRADGIL